MTDKLGHRSDEKVMGVLAHSRLNQSQQWALGEKAVNSIPGHIKEVQHPSLSKSRYCLHFGQHSKDIQANRSSVGFPKVEGIL